MDAVIYSTELADKGLAEMMVMLYWPEIFAAMIVFLAMAVTFALLLRWILGMGMIIKQQSQIIGQLETLTAKIKVAKVAAPPKKPPGS